MIERLTKREFKQLKDLKRRCGSGVLDFMLFEGIDGLPYRCSTKGAAGMKEIWEYQKKLKKQKSEIIRFAELDDLLSSRLSNYPGSTPK